MQTDWQWHQLDHMQTICFSLQTDSHIDTSSRIEVLSVFTPGAVVTVQADWRVLCDQGTEER